MPGVQAVGGNGFTRLTAWRAFGSVPRMLEMSIYVVAVWSVVCVGAGVYIWLLNRGRDEKDKDDKRP